VLEPLPPMKTRQRIMQNYVLVWLDANIDKSQEDFRDSLTKLQCIVSTIDTYTDADQCIECLAELQNEKVFMIVSGGLSQTFIPCVHDLPQLDSIFVFNQNETPHEEWATKWCKMKGFFNHIDLICNGLREAAHLCDQNSVSVSFVSATGTPSNQTLIQIDPTFMYTQLLKEILLEINYDELQAIQEFMKFSRSRCINNPTELSKIEQFERGYHDHTPIWWYTFECSFLYRTLNRALGHLEVDTILNMGFFIQHLHQHIVQLHGEQQPSDPHAAAPYFVYRGQGLSKDDFEKLKNSVGGLMSFNNFLSTSQEQQVAMDFIESARAKANRTLVLFVMVIDPTKIISACSPFARISQVSYFEAEREILFSMNSVFRIVEMKEMEDKNKGVWEVKLMLTSSDSDPEYAALINRLREENTGTTGWTRLGQLLIKLSKYEKAAELYEASIETSPDERWKAHYSYMLGLVKFAQGEYVKAISFYENAVKIFQKDLSLNLGDLASSYNNIGLVYWTTGDYPQALLFYEKALEIKQQLLPPNHPNLTSTYNNIGLVYYNMGDYAKALSFHEKAVEIQKIMLPSYHPDLAKSYRCIAMAYDKTGKFKESLEFYDKIIDIQKKSLPPNHPDLATSYNSLGEVYKNMGDYSKALSYYEQALTMKEKYLSAMDPEMAFSYNNIATVYLNTGDYAKALSFYEKTMEIQNKYLPPNHPDIAASYMNIGNMYCCTGEYSMAKSYYEKCVEIQEKILPPEHHDWVPCYYNLGELYYHMENYSAALSSLEHCLKISGTSSENENPISPLAYHCLGKVYQSMNDCVTALHFYQKTLDIRERTLPDKHPDLANTYSSMGDIHRVMGRYKIALLFHRKALDIQENVTCNELDIATTYNNLGETLREMHDYSSALIYYNKALGIREKLLPKIHLDLAVTHDNLAQVYYATGEYYLAIEHVKLAIEIGQQKLPENHRNLLNYAKTLENIQKKL
jgi:tetratricopeptide (TPR) repeat protein